MIDSMTASGLDVETVLQIPGLTNETDIESLNNANDADIQKYFD
jgi:hypothetical protein